MEGLSALHALDVRYKLMIRIFLFFLITVSCMGEEILPVPTSEKNPYTQRIRLSSFEEAAHHLGGGDDAPQTFLFQVLKGVKIVLSLPVRSLTKDLRDKVRKDHSASSGAGLLTLLWSDDYMYLTIVERYDHDRPPGISLPSAITYWFGKNPPLKCINSEQVGAANPLPPSAPEGD